MKKSLSALVVILATWMLPLEQHAHAQMDFSLDDDGGGSDASDDGMDMTGDDGDVEQSSGGGSFSSLASAA